MGILELNQNQALMEKQFAALGGGKAGSVYIGG